MDTEHKSSPSRRTSSRRTFLLAVGAGGVAAAAAVISRGTPSSKPSSAKDNSGSQGYRLTEHVRNYYRTAQI